MFKAKAIFLQTCLGVAFLFFSTLLLVKAREFLIPVCTAVILALLILPLSQKMELGFLKRPAASFLNSLLLLLLSLGFFFFISFQVMNIVEDWSGMRESLHLRFQELKELVPESIPASNQELQGEELNLEEAGQDLMATSSDDATSYFNTVLRFLGDFLLTFIYIFFLLNYRTHFQAFLLQLFPEEKSEEVKRVINRSATVTRQYLIGKMVLIAILASLYAIGLGISGVENFLLISILAAILSLIPYIGNVLGFGIAMTFGYLVSGETGILAGIVITFSVAQFVESYILEPYIVGDRVDLHPFTVILAVVIGNYIWGIMGMILSIPILAIINVVLLDIPALHPFGFLLSNKPPSEKN